MKVLRFISDNILFFISLFLLAFIPLYPKLPLVDVKGTWVYIRIEDFIVAFVILIWIILFLLKKVILKTPLTLPILIFWILGGISVIHAVLLIFPTLSDVFPNVAFLSFLRRIEYLFLFFVAFAGMRDKRFIYYVVAVLSIVILLIVGYGFGQKLLGFPAFLTMNEEFAKGVPIRLSQLSRVPSTFAGHYDLAAYLVLIIPILVSLAFGFRSWIVKVFFLVTAGLGFALLFTTVSRVSFFVLLISMASLFLLQKKKFAVISLFVVTIVFLNFFPSLLERFGNTVSEVDVLVNAKTGEAIGHVKEVSSSYFEGKIVLRDFAQSEQDPKLATSSAVVPLYLIPSQPVVVSEPNEPTGENLPQGTSYINLSLSPVVRKASQYFYQKTEKDSAESGKIYMLNGDFLIKKAKAYDLSFTTRFQGEWPKTITAFKRNIILGSGYSSVSLAVDNNYLRILGESGLLGFVSFLSIFLIAGIYIKKVLPNVDSPIARSFVLGLVAGTFGLALNAVFIDVFEASKIAFSYWLLMGMALGLLSLYKKDEINLFKEFKKAVSSNLAIAFYLFAIVMGIFLASFGYYFVGDDFTWFRWVSDCCSVNRIISYFTDANGFFYRPGTKVYFSLMNSIFWLNQNVYHFVSILLHFIASFLVFVVSQKVLKNYLLSVGTSLLFIILSGHHEAIFWISSTGFLFNAVFGLLSLLCFMYWKEKKKSIYFIVSLISIVFALLFHELGVIVPLLLILYDSVFYERFSLNNIFRKSYYYLLMSPVFAYLVLRLMANSHWFSGDYSYNLLKLPYNIVGNTIGYITIAFFGLGSMPLYQGLRSFGREHVVFTMLSLILIISFVIVAYRLFIKKIAVENRRIIIFGFLFFIIALLPFLGLGTITSRYSYLSSVGFVILAVFFFKKIYLYLINGNGRLVAGFSIAIVIIIFCANQIFQLQKINSDWKTAGEKSKRFIVSLEGMYEREWKNDSLKFYFVDVPIRNGEAWVFPVGLPDAVWLLFRNENIDIYQLRFLKEAIGAVKDPRTEKVFEFDEQGGVVERKKAQDGSVIPID